MVKTAWEAAKILPVPWATSIWFPFGTCLFLVLLITISTLIEEKPTIYGWIFGLFIGLLNSLVVFAAVMGISDRI